MFISYLNVWQAMMSCTMCLFELIKVSYLSDLSFMSLVLLERREGLQSRTSSSPLTDCLVDWPTDVLRGAPCAAGRPTWRERKQQEAIARPRQERGEGQHVCLL